MTSTTPKSGSIVRGSLFPEPVQIIICTPLGAAVKLIGKGLDSGRVYEPVLDAEQLASLQVSPEKPPFDGDPLHFRLGVEALRLALAYEYVALVGKDNKVRVVDLGLVHSSQANSMVKLIVDRLRQDGDIETGVSPNFLVRNWPPAFTEWSTKSVRDAFFASPQFPRLLDGDSVKETIARGVSSGILGYVGKSGTGYKPFVFGSGLGAAEVEVFDDMFIITADEAKKHIEPPKLTTLTIHPERPQIRPGAHITFQVKGLDQHGRPIVPSPVTWAVKGGSGDGNGGFSAGQVEGEFLVEAVAGDLRAQTAVLISKQENVPPPPLHRRLTGRSGACAGLARFRRRSG